MKHWNDGRKRLSFGWMNNLRNQLPVQRMFKFQIMLLLGAQIVSPPFCSFTEFYMEKSEFYRTVRSALPHPNVPRPFLSLPLTGDVLIHDYELCHSSYTEHLIFVWVKDYFSPNWLNCCVPQIPCYFAESKIINLNSSYILMFSFNSF